MKTITLLTLALVLSLWPLSSHADIFGWTDPQGIVHLTNLNPPEHAQIILKTREIGPTQTDGDDPNPADHKKKLKSYKESREISLTESAPQIPQHTDHKSKPVQAALPTDKLVVTVGSNGTHRHSIRYRKIFPNRYSHKDRRHERHRYRKERRYHRHDEHRKFHRDKPLRYHKPSRYYMGQGDHYRNRHRLPWSRPRGIDRGHPYKYRRW